MKLPIALLALVAFASPACAGATALPPTIKPTFSDVTTILSPPTPGPAASTMADAGGGVSRSTIDAILGSQRNSQTLTAEDVLAAMTRPIRLYDTNGDGLSADELALPGKIRLAQARAQALVRFLGADLDDDRQVTRAEFDVVLKTGQMFGRQLGMFEAADKDGNGVLTWEEMEALQPGAAQMGDMQQRQLEAVTKDVDPTPDTNFTLDDARTAAATLMTAVDTDRNGVLDANEIAAARQAGFRPAPRTN